MNNNEISRIYDLYFDTVYRVCFLYTKNHTDAQDLTQETFCKMLHKPFNYNTDEQTKSWLIVCASNLCKNHLKKWWNKKRLPYEEAILKSYEEKADNTYQIIMGLDKKYSIPTYLYYYEGYKTAEIAQFLNQKTSTIQTRLAKARELLRMELSD